jgi:hypothetical protein
MYQRFRKSKMQRAAIGAIECPITGRKGASVGAEEPILVPVDAGLLDRSIAHNRGQSGGVGYNGHLDRFVSRARSRVDHEHARYFFDQVIFGEITGIAIYSTIGSFRPVQRFDGINKRKPSLRIPIPNLYRHSIHSLSERHLARASIFQPVNKSVSANLYIYGRIFDDRRAVAQRSYHGRMYPIPSGSY